MAKKGIKVMDPKKTDTKPKPKPEPDPTTDAINKMLRKKHEEYQKWDHPMNRPIPARRKKVVAPKAKKETKPMKKLDKSGSAYERGLRAGLEKRALGGMGTGALMGALGGAVTTPKDEKTGNRSILKMIVRAILGGTLGAPIGSMVEGGMAGGAEGAGSQLRGDVGGILDTLKGIQGSDIAALPGKALQGGQDFAKGLGLDLGSAAKGKKPDAPTEG